MKINNLAVALLLLFFGMVQAYAGEDLTKELTTPAATSELPTFRRGGQEVEVLAGSLFSVSGNVPRRPALNYALQAVRYGWMFDDVHGNSFLRGNDEFLLEAFGGEVFTGPGHALGGGMLILRHNFVQDGSRLVPYIQIGGGGLDNNIYPNQTQRRIGEAFEFMLHGGLGVRLMLNNHWAISTEAEYRHISNAGLASRNAGLDSIGGTVGFNYLF